MQPNNHTLKGYVEAYFIDRQGNYTTALEKKNLILPNAKTLITRTLAGDNFHIDHVDALNGGSILTSEPIDSYSFPNLNQVVFRALFEETDAVGVIDEFHLKSANGGKFSQLGSISITKPGNVKLLVVWKITLLDCSADTYTNLLPDGIEIGEALEVLSSGPLPDFRGLDEVLILGETLEQEVSGDYKDFEDGNPFEFEDGNPFEFEFE